MYEALSQQGLKLLVYEAVSQRRYTQLTGPSHIVVCSLVLKYLQPGTKMSGRPGGLTIAKEGKSLVPTAWKRRELLGAHKQVA